MNCVGTDVPAGIPGGSTGAGHPRGIGDISGHLPQRPRPSVGNAANDQTRYSTVVSVYGQHAALNTLLHLTSLCSCTHDSRHDSGDDPFSRTQHARSQPPVSPSSLACNMDRQPAAAVRPQLGAAITLSHMLLTVTVKSAPSIQVRPTRFWPIRLSGRMCCPPWPGSVFRQPNRRITAYNIHSVLDRIAGGCSDCGCGLNPATSPALTSGFGSARPSQLSAITRRAAPQP